MDFWIFMGVCLILVLVVLAILDIRRNLFYKEIAAKYNLKFEKPRFPLLMKGVNNFYPLRKISGTVATKNILIEDVASSPFSIGLFSNILPRPVFGSRYGRVKTMFVVDNAEVKDVYMKETTIAAPNFVAPQSVVENFLSKIN